MIKEIKDKAELKQALDLVNAVFAEFVAVDYSEQGKNTFMNYLENKYEEVASDLLSGHKKAWCYYENNKIVGVIATRDTSHIALMFVEKNHHRKGISKQLFLTVVEEMRVCSNADEITVNSSPYAVEIYERLGFVKTDDKQEKDGIIYIPMKYTLKRNTNNEGEVKLETKPPY